MSGQASPLLLIAQARPTLNAAMSRVADEILTAPQDVAACSITRLARRADTAPSTVTRLATRLGYAGYPAFRAAIAEENGRDAQAGWQSDIGTEIGPHDPADQVLGVLAGAHARAARHTLDQLDVATASALADALAAAGRIHLFGEWADAVPADELYLRLLRIGRPVWRCHGGQEIRQTARLLGSDDVALAVCRTGVEAAAVTFLETARTHGATTAVITGAPDGPVARTADLVLDAGTHGGTVWTDFFAGRAGDALVAGFVWVLVAQRVADRFEHLPHLAVDDVPTTTSSHAPQSSQPTPRTHR